MTDPAERLRAWLNSEYADPHLVIYDGLDRIGRPIDVLDQALAAAYQRGRDEAVERIREAVSGLDPRPDDLRHILDDAQADHTPSGRPKINHRNTDDLFEMVPDAQADR